MGDSERWCERNATMRRVAISIDSPTDHVFTIPQYIRHNRATSNCVSLPTTRASGYAYNTNATHENSEIVSCIVASARRREGVEMNEANHSDPSRVDTSATRSERTNANK